MSKLHADITYNHRLQFNPMINQITYDETFEESAQVIYSNDIQDEIEAFISNIENEEFDD